MATSYSVPSRPSAQVTPSTSYHLPSLILPLSIVQGACQPTASLPSFPLFRHYPCLNYCYQHTQGACQPTALVTPHPSLLYPGALTFPTLSTHDAPLHPSWPFKVHSLLDYSTAVPLLPYNLLHPQSSQTTLCSCPAPPLPLIILLTDHRGFLPLLLSHGGVQAYKVTSPGPAPWNPNFPVPGTPGGFSGTPPFQKTQRGTTLLVYFP